MSFYLVDDERVTHDHDPNANRIYGIDVRRTMADGDSVSTAQAYVNGAPEPGVVVQGSVLGLRFAGGTVGTPVAITFRWTTVLGDTDERTIYLNVKER